MASSTDDNAMLYTARNATQYTLLCAVPLYDCLLHLPQYSILLSFPLDDIVLETRVLDNIFSSQYQRNQNIKA